MSKGWDSNMLKKLKTLIGKGLSASEIGKRLEVSKNAVIGKLNRLGWNPKATEVVETKNKTKKENKVAGRISVKKTTAKVVAKKISDKKSVKSKKVPVVKLNKKTVATKKDKSVKTDIKVVKPVIKTASKKTKKDLALHELLIQHALQMANLKPNQCRWPIGDPDSENFHFCGEAVFSGKPYCYEHCRQAYQFTPPKKK
ncbi:MAG: hypothetical protein IJL05_04955 [Alphaproteobacteria bacterium]|nr:hypothetical protein [Alphaproteobacteria bacterium]